MSNFNLSDLTELFTGNQTLLQSEFNIWQIVLSLLITLIMVLFVYFVYKKTYNGVLYSKNFNITLIMTALVVNAIMIGISGNIVLSLGMVGALSIIRFRTAVKDPKDTAYLFWAITIGIINSVAYYELSLMATIFIAIILFILSRHDNYEPTYVLIVKYRGAKNTFAEISKVLEKYFGNKYFIRNDSNDGKLTEKVIEAKIKEEEQEDILADIRKISDVKSCVLLASNGEFAE